MTSEVFRSVTLDTQEMPEGQQMNGLKTLQRILNQSHVGVRWPFWMWDESAYGERMEGERENSKDCIPILIIRLPVI